LPVGPEVGAVCGKAACTDLCGGREVTRVPTAKFDVCRLMLHLLTAAYGTDPKCRQVPSMTAIE
jgi:hypothetical protein